MQSLFLGYLGEHQSRVIRFWVKKYLEQFPDCTFSILHKRSTDSAAYPIAHANMHVKNNWLLWDIQSSDVAIAGKGQCELVATDNGSIIKSEIFETLVSPALDDSQEPPEPWESWVQEVIESAELAENAVSQYPMIVGNYWHVWNVREGQWENTGVRAKGAEGLTGVQIAEDDYVLQSEGE